MIRRLQEDWPAFISWRQGSPLYPLRGWLIVTSIDSGKVVAVLWYNA